MASVPDIITDNEGKRYELVIDEDNGFLFFAVEDAGRQVGLVSCREDGNSRWRIEDFTIEDAAIIPPSVLRRLLRLKPRKENYRRRGIGGALMASVIAEARRRGVRCLRGSVVESDLNGNPRLLEWYERLGFRVVEPEVGDIAGAVAVIQLEL
jgi:GNAT superfamily N-acetyltransferase